MTDELGGKALRRSIRQALLTEGFEPGLPEYHDYPPRRLVRPLVSFLGDTDPKLKSRAISALGNVTARLADVEMEEARVVVRTLMWNLTEECGTIGWGMPEALGEILAQHTGLAAEFTHVLVSYIREDGGYLEFEPLQRGAVWGIGRLAEAQPDLVRGLDAVRYLEPLLDSENEEIRKETERALGILQRGY